jgi:hypothetical protein
MISYIISVYPSHALSYARISFKFITRAAGAGTHAQGTTPLPAPRSLVELLILEHLAPAALGDLAAARDRLGFLGAEWWVQARDDGPAAHATTAAPNSKMNQMTARIASAVAQRPAETAVSATRVSSGLGVVTCRAMAET